MSPKNQTRPDPRIAPKEMIVTRRKSALQRRQLRDKDRSMRSITQLLKSPTRSSQSPKKKLSPKGKSPKKPQSPGSVKETTKLLERRPKVETNRVWLKPRHNFKMVAKTNKRKRCVPQKEIAPFLFSTQPAVSPRVDEDCDSLDDEGLMEILTCPSPVWWEDPPDPSYEEDAICIRPPSPEQTTKHFESPTETFTNDKSNNKHEQKFMNKRKKLENILGCIKSRINIDNDIDDKSDQLDTDLINHELLSDLENIDIPIEPIRDNSNEVINEKHDNELSNEIDRNEIDHNEIDHNEIGDVKNVIPEDLPPLQRNNQEMLSSLENIDIPVEPIGILNSNEVKNEKEDDSEFANEINVDNVIPENLPPLQRNPMHSTLNSKNVMTEKNITNTTGDDKDNDTVFDRNEIKLNAMESPVSVKNESKDLDTISDTNIKFIDNVEDKELDDTSQLILDKIKKFFQEKEKKIKKEYITVYKIVDNDERQEIKNDDQSKINYFYKKCKNVRKKCDLKCDKVLKNSESNTLAPTNSEVKNDKVNVNSESKTLALTDSEMKYCFKCSSIFETKECYFCAMSESSEALECVCKKSHDFKNSDCFK